jgi:hypothetical protein
MIRNADAISSPVRLTNHVAMSGVNPPITPKQTGKLGKWQSGAEAEPSPAASLFVVRAFLARR